MFRVHCSVLPVLILSLAISSSSRASDKSQNASSDGNSNDTPVFRSTTRIVLVDVVATDSDGNPIRDLKSKDFEISDGGKRQSIEAFNVHTAEDSHHAPAEEPPVLAPGVYSNWAPTAPSGPINIILFDTLNMDFADQGYARMRMVQYLKTLPSGQQMALFTLGDHLQMVQSFTGSTDTLLAAANKLGALGSFKTSDNPSQAQTQSVPQGTQPNMHTVSTILESFQDAEAHAMVNLRMQITLQALRELARSLGTMPGRKNLIWVSGDFPALMGSSTERSGFQPYRQEIRTTSALLAAHQVAVYPVDARGLLIQPTSTSAASNGATVVRQLTEKMSDNSLRDPYSDAVQNFSQGLQTTHDAMDEIAQQTGGRAFYNTNDISTAIGKSIESGANYYTLAYAPTNKNWDGQLRKIEVKVARHGVKLTYRRGYYAIADPFAPVLKIKTTKMDVQKRLIEAVQPNSPQISAITLNAKIITSGPDKPLEIAYQIDTRDLTLDQIEDGTRTVKYQLVAVAWDDKGNNADQAWEMVDKDISPQMASEILRNGIHSHRFLTLKPGTYRLYLGLIDLESKKIGTLTMPLNIPKQNATLKPVNIH